MGYFLLECETKSGSFTAFRMTNPVRICKKQKPGARPSFCVVAVAFANAVSVCLDGRSLGGHFFGFAFLAHDFEFAFLRLDLCGDFLLDALCRFFQFW